MQRQLDELQRRGPVDGPNDADETLRRTLVLAQRTADATIKEAKDEANQLLSEAREEAARTRAAAESDARRDAKVEIEQLAGTRESLLQDIEQLERHLDDQRNSIRTGLEELLHLLDDPTVLRSEPAPEVSDVTPPPRYDEPSHDLPNNGQLTPNGSGPVPGDVGLSGTGRPSAVDGSMLAALQELPRREPLEPRREPLETREPPEPAADPLPPTEPAGFPAASPAGATGFFPDLNSVFNPPSPPEPPADRSLDDLALPIDAPPPPPPPPGLEHMHDVGGIPIEPGSRPSEWGRGVFDNDDDLSESPRFGRR